MQTFDETIKRNIIKSTPYSLYYVSLLSFCPAVTPQKSETLPESRRWIVDAIHRGSITVRIRVWVGYD